MFYISNQDKKYYYVKCSKCNKEQKIEKSNVMDHEKGSYWAFNSIGCTCGHSSKLIENKKPPTPKIKHSPPVDNTPISCPKCGSTQISANRKGFGLGKALAGGALAGGVGLLGGFIGSNKVECTCLNCGYKFSAGKK
jgi:ssDNA-binding Zn-finger/Zn-ribbon topoisomerase 1